MTVDNSSSGCDSEVWTLPSQLQGDYGDVFTVYLGSRPVLILCQYEAIKEALDKTEVFSCRGTIKIAD